ncbi:bifunctional 4-hydroxy-2-oxoglutarate aldolase/2-dehydro-3-deoxy-phosphogluconate aldolase [Coprothermobacter proteolyticus]|nr:bifunctional 4-hydroxy-2-oxoglutarate aldolase/2-dehydro-3-deoxy-phosphogluconate aldolase [Coprothermobacter sp.]NLT84340.1 bifunctional 4-hydroxy-2-oxoglutarate aldolase/2-dehydro-3-deoxy-phosphogluconate aldolase [Coprothermobacter proteolyticus]
MKDYEVLSKIKELGVCAIVRGTSAESLFRIADALIEGGIGAIEVTFDTPGAPHMVEELAKKYSNRILIGAGTVLDPETARIAILSGARFILAPSLNIDVVRTCQRYSVLPVPGILTPTEAVLARENGVQLVKVFPAGVMGPNYIKQLKSPLPQVEMMAVGAINTENFADFIKAGACSAGIGSDLVNKKLVEEGNFSEITRRAKTFTDIFAEIKNMNS